MRMLLGSFLLFGLAACAGSSYGASTDGSFPPRPAGADYPNWEHMCVNVTGSSATQTLNESGAQGWELVDMGALKGETMMCFKRVKPAS